MFRIAFVLFATVAPTAFAMPTYRICEGMTTRNGGLSATQKQEEVSALYSQVIAELRTQVMHPQASSSPLTNYVLSYYQRQTGRNLDFETFNRAISSGQRFPIIEAAIREYARTKMPYLNGAD